jgi:transposase
MLHMSNLTLSDPTWQSIYAFLKTCPGIYVKDELKCRRFVEALHWIARSGAQWRLLPEPYGIWNSVFKRFARWSEKGIWQRLFEHCAGDPDLEWLSLDSTIIRAHPCAAGALKKTADKSPKPSVGVAAASAPRFISSSMPWAIP